MAQVRARNFDDLDALVRRVMSQVGGDIERRSLGDEATPALLDFVAQVDNSGLSDECGEGYRILCCCMLNPRWDLWGHPAVQSALWLENKYPR